VRLVLSRKGFDTSSGGYPSPIFPDGSMIALPIPDKRSPLRYGDLTWRGRNLGQLVEKLTRGRLRPDDHAHLDPDLRRDIYRRASDWRPAFGQVGAAKGHLRKQGVGAGDLFLFWGLFREVNSDLRWIGRPTHRIWGWLQVEREASVDTVIRVGGTEWDWARTHPHYSFLADTTNTLYVAAERLAIPGVTTTSVPGSGVFESAAGERCLTHDAAVTPSDWRLPVCFLPRGRPALSYHARQDRWKETDGSVRLRVVGRGQEFVLDLDQYPAVLEWVKGIIGAQHR
jgi:hypothetical protein